MGLAQGSRLGSHEILGPIGAGGMGEVYLAHDTKLNRRVAIKILPDAFASDPERIARFHREAQAVAALNHPRIAAIYDFAQAPVTDPNDAPIRYFVLELVEGDTLADRVARGPVPAEEAIQIGIQILEALEAAHEKGICHRDLKPANVKLTSAGAVKVLDFGLAKFVEAGGTAAGSLTHSPTLTLGATIPGVVLGTAAYMSPEQAKGFEADQRSDIFSFGCILYELLTGRPAFDGETVSEILASVLKIDVDLSALPPDLNPRLVDLLKQCFEKNPKKRWHAAADVRVQLESIAGHALVHEDARTSGARRRPLWQGVAALAGAAAVAAATAWIVAWKIKPEPSRQISRFTVPLADNVRFSNTGRQVLALSADGTKLLYVADRKLYLRSMGNLNAQVIAGSDLGSGLTNPVFSPDGQAIVFFSQSDQKLKRLSTAGGSAVTLCDAANPYGMSWSEHGIVYAQPGRGILRLLAEGGSPEVISAEGEQETLGSPQMLPGGKALLYSVKKRSESWKTGQVVVQPLGGARKTLVTGADGRFVPTGHLVYALEGVLMAIRFDVSSLTVSGGSVPIVEGVQRAIGTPQSGVAQFSFSDTGSLVYVPGPVKTESSEEGTNLALFDRTGNIEPIKFSRGPYQTPRVTRDGKWVAYERADESETSIWTYELAGGHAPQRLTFEKNSTAPVWSPDGQWIAFRSDDEGDAAIFRRRADGSGKAERLTKPETGVAHVPHSWSPDGKYLLFVAEKDAQRSLKTLSLSDQKIADFGDMPAREGIFAPDGRWVAYSTSAGPGAPGTVFIEPFPRDGTKYQLNVPGGHPVWSLRGDEIIVNTGPNVSNVVSVTWAPRIAFGEPQAFSRRARRESNPATSLRQIDMMPDKRVIGVMSSGELPIAPIPTPNSGEVPTAPNPSRARDTSSAEIVVVLNWFDELRHRVSGK